MFTLTFGLCLSLQMQIIGTRDFLIFFIQQKQKKKIISKQISKIFFFSNQFYNWNQRRNATTIATRHTVNFIHNNTYFFPFLYTSLKTKRLTFKIEIFRFFFQTFCASCNFAAGPDLWEIPEKKQTQKKQIIFQCWTVK